MGQGYSLTTLSAGSAGIDVPELADLTYEKSLGTARFMKTVRAKHRDGLVVAKVVMKPYTNMKLDPYVQAILRMRLPKSLDDYGWITLTKATQVNGKPWQAFRILYHIIGCWKRAQMGIWCDSICTARCTTA